MPPNFLSVPRVLKIHEKVVLVYGGETGLRDSRLLESAVFMPQSGMGGEYFHEDIFAMAAAYLYHIVQNHPFVDGNKRTGIAAALLFLKRNGFNVPCNDDALTDMVLGVAEGSVSKELAADFFRKHSIRRIDNK